MENIICTEELKKYFSVKKGGLFSKNVSLRAVDGVNIKILRGKTLGLVGESGCGKTTFGRVILRLLDPTSGKIVFNDTDITNLKERYLRPLRKKMQIIFQDPYSSLNPRLKVGYAVKEVMDIHKIGKNTKERKERVCELFKLVGLSPDHYDRYPHEFSGGQRQRICIARSLAGEPDFIVCDEPVSALDVSIQAQILNLLMDLQEKFSLSYLFISHDLSVVEHISDRVAVMYLGKIVEEGPVNEVINNPLHPYTEALISCAVRIDDKGRKKIILHGDVPSPVNIPEGCRFHPRCPKATAECKEAEPVLEEKRPNHKSACILKD